MIQRKESFFFSSSYSIYQDNDDFAKRCCSFLLWLVSLNFIHTIKSLSNKVRNKLYSQTKNVPSFLSSSLSAKQRECLVVVDVQPQFWTNVPSIRQDFPKFEHSTRHAIDTFRKNNGVIVWIRCDYNFDKSKWLSTWAEINPTKQHKNVCDVKDANSNGWPTRNVEKIKWENFATPDMNSPNEYLVCKSNWNGVTRTKLIEILNKYKFSNVYVCGLITSVCVQATSYGLFEAGFDITLLEHCCGDRGKHRHEAALLLYKNYMYRAIDNECDVESIFNDCGVTTCQRCDKLV